MPVADVLPQSAGSHDREVRHHPLIFMFELVTMDEIPAAVCVEADQDVDRLAIVQEHGIFPPALPWEDLLSPAAARLYLERGAMNMNGMRSVALGRKPPKLRLTEGNLEVNAVEVILLAVD